MKDCRSYKLCIKVHKNDSQTCAGPNCTHYTLSCLCFTWIGTSEYFTWIGTWILSALLLIWKSRENFEAWHFSIWSILPLDASAGAKTIVFYDIKRWNGGSVTSKYYFLRTCIFIILGTLLLDLPVACPVLFRCWSSRFYSFQCHYIGWLTQTI